MADLPPGVGTSNHKPDMARDDHVESDSLLTLPDDDVILLKVMDSELGSDGLRCGVQDLRKRRGAVINLASI